MNALRPRMGASAAAAVLVICLAQVTLQRSIVHAARQPTVVPKGFPLAAEDQKRVDAILSYWEYHTNNIKTFQAKFTRQNFDLVFGPKDRPRTIDKGTVRYAAPDKGLMRVDTVYVHDPNAVEGKPPYRKQETQFGEYWVCDGASIYQFDARTKTLTETILPESMRGKSIGDGPLPFLFGAKSDQMKSRYWIRERTPSQEVQDEYWLEAIPKRAEDAANFDRVFIQLKKPTDRGGQLMPKAMKLYNKQGYVIYHFEDQRVNDPRHRVAGFFRSFVRPALPRGWKKVVEDWSGDQVDGAMANQPALRDRPRSSEASRVGVSEPRKLRPR